MGTIPAPVPEQRVAEWFEAALSRILPSNGYHSALGGSVEIDELPAEKDPPERLLYVDDSGAWSGDHPRANALGILVLTPRVEIELIAGPFERARDRQVLRDVIRAVADTVSGPALPRGMGRPRPTDWTLPLREAGNYQTASVTFEVRLGESRLETEGV